MLKQRKSIVGLDIGTSCIKAVELTRDKYDHVITGYAQVDVQNEAARQDAIAELMRVAKFRTKRIATAVSGNLSAEVTSCAQAVVSSGRFDPPKGGAVSIAIPLTFAPK